MGKIASICKNVKKKVIFRKICYLCRRKVALDNLKASFHCAHLHYLCKRYSKNLQKHTQ